MKRDHRIRIEVGVIILTLMFAGTALVLYLYNLARSVLR